MKITVLIPLLAGMLCLCQWASAATLYVEDAFGDDNSLANDCRDRANPCATITHALSVSEPRDRIIVGPGNYGDELTNLDIDDARKVTSVAGASATIIDLATSAASFLGAVDIFEANKAVFGQKGRGFTVLVDESETGILVDESSGVKVEGNTVIVNNEEMLAGIRNRESSKTTIRGNRVITRGFGAFDVGILVDFVEANGPVPAELPTNDKLRITDNTVSHQGEIYLIDCIEVASARSNHRNRIQNNRLEGCLNEGIRVLNQFDGGLLTRSGDRIQGNLIMSSESGFDGIDVSGGNPAISKNFIDATDGNGIGVFFADKPKVSDNLVILANAGEGLGFSSVNSASVTGNTVHNTTTGVFTDDFANIKTFRKNNIVNTLACPFFTSNDAVYAGNKLSASGNFWNGLSVPQIVVDGACGFDNKAEDAIVAGNLSFKPTLKPNPVKFKNIFD